MIYRLPHRAISPIGIGDLMTVPCRGQQCVAQRGFVILIDEPLGLQQIPEQHPL